MHLENAIETNDWRIFHWIKTEWDIFKIFNKIDQMSEGSSKCIVFSFIQNVACLLSVTINTPTRTYRILIQKTLRPIHTLTLFSLIV